jgi:hypothetical protein
MKSLHFFVLLMFVFCVPAHADDTHVSKQFEAILVDCLPGGKKDDNCLTDTLLQFTKNQQITQKLPGVIGGLFNQIIGDRQVYAVHPIFSKKLGDFLVEENIIIESDSGHFSLLRVLFSKTLDVWQVRNVHLSSQEDTIENALNLKL